MSKMPNAGELYQHRKGHFYVVLGIALNEPNVSNAVVYQAINGGQVWVRPLAEWDDEVEPGTPRFALVEGEERAKAFNRWPNAPRAVPWGLP